MMRPSDDIIFVKARITAYLSRLATDRQHTHAEAGMLMGIAPEEVARLFGDGAQEYSLARLMGFLTAFGLDVEITTRPAARAAKGSYAGF